MKKPRKKAKGKSLVEVFGFAKNTAAEKLANLTLTDIESITLENSDDSLTIKVLLPLDDGTFSEYEETIPFDDFAPNGLHEIAKRFSTAALSAVKARTMKDRPVPCETCTGACCYKYDEVRLSSEDITMLHRAFGDDAMKGYTLYATGERWTGYVGALKKAPRKIGDQELDSACVYLRSDGCSIYENRPTVCREYSPWTCGDTYEADPKKLDGKVRLRVLS
jgi:Fe-S-cluster containining protein